MKIGCIVSVIIALVAGLFMYLFSSGRHGGMFINPVIALFAAFLIVIVLILGALSERE